MFIFDLSEPEIFIQSYLMTGQILPSAATVSFLLSPYQESVFGQFLRNWQTGLVVTFILTDLPHLHRNYKVKMHGSFGWKANSLKPVRNFESPSLMKCSDS